MFPPLVNNSAILDVDPADHINAIVHGVSGKVIDGVCLPVPCRRSAPFFPTKKLPRSPSEEVRTKLRADYAENADSLTAASQVVAINFQTVAAANGYWH